MNTLARSSHWALPRHWFAACAMALSTASAGAAQVELVADLFTGQNRIDGGEIGAAIAFDGLSFFTTSSYEEGSELWVTDGTPGGTRRHADICPGRCSSSPGGFSVLDGRLYFAANDRRHGRELWMLEGSEDAPRLIADIAPGIEGSSPSVVSRMTFRVGASVVARNFLTAFRPDTGTELWRLQGETVTLERDLTSGPGWSFPSIPVSFGDGRVLTQRRDVSGRAIPAVLNYSSISAPPDSVSDLSGFPAAGTTHDLHTAVIKLGARSLLRRIGRSGNPSQLWVVDDASGSATLLVQAANISEPIAHVGLARFFFTSGSNALLHVSDGTPAGTFALGATPASQLTALGQRLMFLAGVGGSSSNIELFASDGTVAGTQLVTEIVAGAQGSGGRLHRSTDGVRLYHSFGSELWIGDGTAAGTQRIGALAGGSISLLFPVQGRMALLAAQDGEPHATSGVANDIRRLAEVRVDVGNSFVVPHAGLDGRVLANAVVVDSASAVTIGIDAATGLHEVLSSTAAFTNRGRRVGDRLLWRDGNVALSTDVTLAGTTTLALSSFSIGEGCGTVRDGVFFTATSSGGGDQVLRSDGTAAGTFNLTQHAGSFFESCQPHPSSDDVTVIGFGEALLLSGLVSGTGPGGELLRFDEGVGARVLADINPGTPSSLPASFETLGAQVLFAADDGLNGRELWSTDGTAQGTRLVRDIEPGSIGSDVRSLRRLGGRVVFSTLTASGRELWTSDGSNAGTAPLIDLFPGAGSGIAYVNMESGGIRSPWLHANATHGLFAGAVSGASADSDCPLFITDGTPAGTRCALLPGSPGALPFSIASEASFTASGDIAFIAHTPTRGEEVFVLRDGALLDVDGTDLVAGPEGSAPLDLTVEGDVVYFSANDGEHGFELHRVDLSRPSALFGDGFE